MSVWTALILGLLAGWLMEWVIDWLYWRRAQPAAPLAANTADDERLRTDLEAARNGRRDAEARLAKANADLEAARAAQAKLQGDLNAANELAASRKAELDASEARSREASDDGARTLAAGVLGGASMQTMHLGAANDDENARLRAELDSLRGELARVKVLHADRLIDINGIGPVYERRLQEAGIYTFAELAASSPERLREIIGPEGWQNIDPTAWIAEAQAFAARSGRRSQ